MPGDTLSTYALAKELEISRTPIIQALKRLETEGLVQIIPQVGCRVISPSSAAVEELYALRGVLEALATGNAATRMTDRELRELRLVMTRMDSAVAAEDQMKYEDLNYQFHTRITEGSRMPRVDQITRGIWSDLRFQLARLPLPPALIVASQVEHQEIFDALERRSEEDARAAAERHALQSGQRFLEHMTEQAASAAAS